MRAVDTNIIVPILLREEPNQTDVAEAFIAKGAWASHLALVEVAWVLRTSYGLTAADIAKAVSMLLEHETLTLQDPDVVAAALEQFRKRPSLGFSDCMILETCRKAGHLPLGTFDRNLAKAEGAARP